MRGISALVLTGVLLTGCFGPHARTSQEVASENAPTFTNSGPPADGLARSGASDAIEKQVLHSSATPAIGVPTNAPSVVGESILGELYWGTNPASGSPWTAAELARRVSFGQQDDVVRQTRRVLQVAEETLGSEVPVVARIDREGKLPSDPRFKASDDAVRSVDRIYQWAMCARVAAEPLAGSCREHAARAVDAWTTTFRPSGNPINDMYLVPVIQAIDLLLPIAAPEQHRRWSAWCLDFARQGDAYYAPLKTTNAVTFNNWASWRLLLRGLTGKVGRDTAVVKSTRELVTAHVERNLRADGSSVDFEERDALHYHTYDLEPLVLLALFVPEVVDDRAMQRIESGLQFLRPFVQGEQTHIEFVRSTVLFDRQRRDAGVAGFSNTAWNPGESRNLLRQARTRFEVIRSWTTNLVDEQYSPRIKQICALRGG